MKKEDALKKAEKYKCFEGKKFEHKGNNPKIITVSTVDIGYTEGSTSEYDAYVSFPNGDTNSVYTVEQFLGLYRQL